MPIQFRRLLAILVMGLVSVSAYQPSFSQSSSSGLGLDKLSQRPNTSLGTVLTAEQMPTDDVVVPSIYFLGPGDIISYRTTGIDFTEKLAVVTPENILLMEHFGMVDVRGLTLETLRDNLKRTMKERAPDIDVYLTLRRARLVYVSLKGNVPFPGTYPVPASMRISTLLSVTRQPWLLRKDGAMSDQMKQGFANSSTTSEALSRSSSPSISGYALRNITVRHRRGVTIVDLAKAQLADGDKYDPHVREGDVVNVPYDTERLPMISVSGSVVTNATLVYKRGDRASLLLAAAGGPTADADLDRVTLVQAGGAGKITLKVNENFEIVGEDPELQPGSSIIVERLISTGDVAKQGVVEVYGEVGQPGTVIITPGKTRVLEAVEASGGVKPGASLALSYIVRPTQKTHSNRDAIDEANKRFMYSDLQLEDTLRYKLDQSYRLPYVSCDLVGALRDSIASENVVLQSGDIIVIESTPDRIYVYGQVNQPGYVQFVRGQTLEWYVEQAGGFAAGAKSGRSRIIKGKTKVWVEDASDALVEPGDEVYVPRAPDIPASVELQYYATVASIVSAVALLAATVLTIVR